MRTFNLLSIATGLAIILSSCNLPASNSPPIKITNTPTSLQVFPTSTSTIIPGATIPVISSENTTVISTRTPTPANTPIWMAYHFTCELATGGANMTMKFTWADRSNSEDGYNIYRDKQLIATLPKNSTSFEEITFVANGGMISYSVEAFNTSWRASSSLITASCQ